MKRLNFFVKILSLSVLLAASSVSGNAQTISFTSSSLAGETVYNPTCLQFGPDGRLYVTQQNGLIHAYTVTRNSANNYSVTATEIITAIQQIPNHNDDGALNTTVNTRQVTGLLVVGTAANPVLYVSSSDPRIGGGTSGPGNDKNLDTNSGMLSKLTKSGNSWTRTDLVRGLPRSEENHSTNGMQLDEVNNILYLCQGGNTNMGAPSNNFIFLPEYAYSAAILKIDLDAIGATTYDLPTLDDESRTNSGAISGYEDTNDPFGGNSGKNQAKLDPAGPVQIYSPGWRNPYDLVITQAGMMYSFDNGPNTGWGGTPASCLNDTSEVGSTYCDYLHHINQGYFAGHPNLTRGNRANTFNNSNPQSPVPAGMENPAECSYIIPGSQSQSMTGICASTNGMAEYTASNFGGSMNGDLLAASFNGKIYRFKLNAAGTALASGGQTVLASGFGSTPLDVTAQGDDAIFPGTIWAVTYGSHGITVLEPGDYDSPISVVNTFRVNCGGSQYVTVANDTFTGDVYYTGGTLSTSTSSIANTDDDVLYKSERYGNFSYDFPVPNGDYQVSLHFAETWSGGQSIGARVFHVDMEGSRVLNNYDIFSNAGGYAARIERFTTSVSDGSLNIVFTKVTNNAKVNAIEVVPFSNTAPTFVLSGDIYVNEDFQGTQFVTVTPDAVPPSESSQTVSYSLSPASVSFANITFNSSTGQVAITSVPNASGSEMFTITANDGQPANNTSSETFMLTVAAVNDAPAFSLSGNVSVNEDFSGTRSVTVTPAAVPADEVAQAVSYSISPASVSFANVSINPSTGNVTITKTANGNGSQTFTVTADDGQSANNLHSQTFSLTVNAVNDAPAFSISGNITADEDFSGSRAVTVTPDAVPSDESSQTVTYSLSPATVSFANVSINPSTGTVTVTSVANKSGAQTFTITADDGQASGNTASQTFTLTVNSVNDAPTFTTSGNVTVDEDFAGAKYVTVTADAIPSDESSQSVTYSLSPASVSFANVSINSATGKVTINAVANKSGSQTFTITANDGQASNNTASQTFTLTVNPVNDAPIFAVSGNVTADEDFSGSRTVTVTADAIPADETLQTVTYSISPLSVGFANVSINASSGMVTIASIPDKSGSQIFTITANDGQASNNTASQTFTLTINPVNDAPAFTVSGNITADEDFTGSRVVTVTAEAVPADETSQSVTYSLNPATVSFANISFNSSTGKVTVTAAANKSGSQLFTITANDGQATNNTASHTFLLTINSVNDVPTLNAISGLSLSENAPDQIISLSGITDGDEGTQTLTITAVSDNPALIPHPTISYASPASSGTLTLHLNSNTNGVAVISVTVNDGQPQNSAFTRNFTVTVGAVNDPPYCDEVQSPITVLEDASLQQLTITGITAGTNEAQTISITAVSDNPALIPNPTVNYINPASTAVLSLTPVANRSGMAVITVTLDDGAASNNTFVRYFTIIVDPVNDAPAINALNDLVLDEDAGLQTVQLSGISAGPFESQSLSITATSDNPTLIPNPAVNYVSPSTTGTISFTPEQNQSGIAKITLTVNDGQSQNNMVTTYLFIMVDAVNDAPVFSVSGDVQVDMNFATTEQVTVLPGNIPSDETAQTVSYSLQPSSVDFAHVSINPSTGTVSITAVQDSFGAQLFTIVANDGQMENNLATATFNLVVGEGNNAPTFTLSGDIIESEDFTGIKRVNVIPDPVRPGEEGQTVTYSLSPASVSFANVSFNPATGAVAVSAKPDASGSQLFTLTANDGQASNNIATKTFMLTVNAVNDAPVFTLSGDVMENEDFSGARMVTVAPAVVPADESSQTVTYSLQPSSIAFADVQINSATGTITITALPDAVGAEVFTITANDGQSQNAIATGSFILSVNEVNDAPEFSVSGNIAEEEDFTGTKTVMVIPSAVPLSEINQPVTYSLSPAGVSFANVSINAVTGEVSVSAVKDKSGSQQFTITAHDGQSLNHSASHTFLLTVNAVNDAPVFTVSGDVLEEEDFTGTATVTIVPSAVPADEALQTVVYSLTPASVSFANIQFNAATGAVTISSVADSSGMEVFTITANDGQTENATATGAFILSIDEMNDAPIFTLSNDVFLSEDFATPATVVVSPVTVPANETAQTVTYSLSPSSVSFAHIQFNPATGEVIVSSLADSSGMEVFTITANDGQPHNAIATGTFILSVNAVNDAPYFSLSGDIIENEDFTGTRSVSVFPIAPHDELNQPVTYSISPASVSFADVHINSATGAISITAVTDSFGTQLFTVTANDGQSSNNTHSESFTLTVIRNNTPPVFSVSGDITVDEDFSSTQFVQVIAAPVPPQDANQTVTYSLSPAQAGFAQVQFDAQTGLVTIHAIPDAYGQQLFTITADDGQPVFNQHAETFVLTVHPVNDAPTINPISGVSILEDEDAQTLSFSGISAGGSEADVLSVSAFSSDTVLLPHPVVQWTHPDAGGTLTFQPAANRFGTAMVTVVVNDGQSSNNIVSRTFSVEVQPVNDAPFMDVIADIVVQEDAPDQNILLTGVSAGPFENDSLTITAASDNILLAAHPVISGNTIVCRLEANATGTARITVTLNDGESYNNTFSRTFTVNVLPVNDVPAFTIDRNMILVAEDFPVAQMAHVTLSAVPADEALQTITYKLTPASVDFAHVMFDSTTGMVTVHSVLNGNGSQVFTIMADDHQSSDNTFTDTFTLEVHPVNDAPEFTLSGDVNVMQNFSGVQTVTATPLPVPVDETNQMTHYTLHPDSVSFANVAIDLMTGVISIQSVTGAFGAQQFIVTADDGQAFNNIATDTFTLTVNQNTNVPDISLSGDIAVDEDFITTEVVTVLASAVSPNSYPVEVKNDVFVPKDIYIFQGDIVEWTNSEGYHNVNADTAVFNTNPESFGNAVDGPGWQFSHQFNIPGTYNYQCDPHAAMGMTGTVTVLPNRPPIKHRVTVSNMIFTPKNLLILQGDTVEWYNAQGYHNVNADVSVYPNNPEGFYNDIEGPGWTFTWIFTKPGFYDYQCDPHVYMDMFGTVRVVERSGTFVADTTLPVIYRLSPATSDLANLHIDSVSGSVLITSKPHRNGTEEFSVIADYGFASRSEEFLLTVRPKDDKPGRFNLLTPANYSMMPANADDLVFTWEPSAEVDGDEMLYTISINGTHDHITIMNISDTTFTLNAGQILKNDTLYEWTVTATDGITDVRCRNPFFLKSQWATGITEISNQPELAVLDYPDPFHESSTLQYRLPENKHVRVVIYNLLGELVRVLAEENQEAGWHEVVWNGRDEAGSETTAGMYFYSVECGGKMITGSMVKY